MLALQVSKGEEPLHIIMPLVIRERAGSTQPTEHRRSPQIIGWITQISKEADSLSTPIAL